MKIKKIFVVGILTLFSLSIIAPLLSTSTKAAPNRIPEWSVISEAYSWLGVPYKYGGESQSGVDCSGLVRQVYMRASEWRAYYFDRTAEGIRQASYPVWPPKPGDVIIFLQKNNHWCTHVGIYIGVPFSNGYWDCYFIHAGYTPGKVVLDRLYHSPYYGNGWFYRNFDIYFARYDPDYWIV